MHDVSTRHLVFETVESLRLVASCQTHEAPADAEWDSWLAAVSELGRTAGEFRLLVITDGGRPTKEQQGRLAQAKRGAELEKGKRQSEPRTALVSSAAGERFWVSILLFMNPAIRCFAPSDLPEAYAHIGLTDRDREIADATLARLRARLAQLQPKR